MGRPRQTTEFTTDGVTIVPTPDSCLAYRVPIAAQMLGVSRSKVWAMISRGDLTAKKIGGTTVIRREDLVAYLDAAPVTKSDQ